jgi:hypothetical protein
VCAAELYLVKLDECISSDNSKGEAPRRGVFAAVPESMLGAAARSLKASISKPVAEIEREGRPSPCQH